MDYYAALKKMLTQFDLKFIPADPEQLVIVNGEDITKQIRFPEITNQVSLVSAQPSVREEMTKRQQEIASAGAIVMDGRDIGTTVLPQAEVKIFLVASVHERAVRRYKENISKGIETSMQTLEDEIKARDYKDSHREISPLTQASDAILLDTTSLNITQVVEKILKFIHEKEKK